MSAVDVDVEELGCAVVEAAVEVTVETFKLHLCNTIGLSVCLEQMDVSLIQSSASGVINLDI